MQVDSAVAPVIFWGLLSLGVPVLLWALKPTRRMRSFAIVLSLVMISGAVIFFAPGSEPLPARIGVSMALYCVAAIVAVHNRSKGRRVDPPSRPIQPHEGEIRGEIVLFEPATPAEHPEWYGTASKELTSSVLEVVRHGDLYDVALSIENQGKPTRLRDWRFRIMTKGGSEFDCYVDPGAWPPPKSWLEQLPAAMTLMAAEASYFLPERVYVVYCQVHIKTYLATDQRSSLLDHDSLEALATDNDGQAVSFKVKAPLVD